MEENTLKEVELITEDRLKELGFDFVDYGDNPPYETYRKGGIEVSEYNGECWLIEMLDQNNIEHPIKYLSELEAFFNGCGKSILSTTAYAQPNETIKVLEYDNNKLKGEAEGLQDAVEELKRWKSEAIILLSKIDRYADKHPDIKLGMCKVEFIIDRAKKFDESAAGREEAVEFAEWAATIAFYDDGTRLWELIGEGEAINGQFRFTTNEFFELFKQQKDK